MIKISTYHPATMALLEDSATGGISLGSVAAGNHNTTAIVVKPSALSGSFSSINLYLESKGSFTSSNFGYYKSIEGITGIVPGSDYLSDNFLQVPSVTGYDAGGIALSPSNPEYVWLDVEVGATDIATDSANYRFVYDFA
jgi:hypothetical protein